MLSDAGAASAARKGWPPQRRSTGSAGAFTTTTSQASVALRSLTPAFNWIATAVLPSVVVCRSVAPPETREERGHPILPLSGAPHRDEGSLGPAALLAASTTEVPTWHGSSRRIRR